MRPLPFRARTLAAAIAILIVVAPTIPIPSKGSPVSEWVFETVDSTGQTGGCPSMAFDALNHIHIAYWRTDVPSIKYAYNNGSSWAIEVVNSTWRPSCMVTSLALNSSGAPGIAYTDGLVLYYSFKEGGVWKTEQVDTGPLFLGSLVMNGTDVPMAAYWTNGGAVKYAYRDAGVWRNEVVDRSPDFAGVRMKIGPDGTIRIIYLNTTSRSFEHALRLSGSWEKTEWHPGGNVGAPDLAFDSTGGLWLAFSENVAGYNFLRLGKPSNITWEEVDTGIPGENPALLLDSHDWPRLAYISRSGLWYLRWQNSTWSSELVNASPGMSWDFSFSLDHDIPHLAYHQNGVALDHATVSSDTQPPDSRVLPFDRFWANSRRQVNASALDAQGYVVSVALWYRFSPDNLTWGAWTSFTTLLSPPWAWAFPYVEGQGFYGFYTTSVDDVGNNEPPPPSADETAGYDTTAPVSAALPISPYWHENPWLIVNATADDNLSGVSSVALFYSYSVDNTTWGPWTPRSTKTSPPWSWPFLFLDGEGYYRFHTVAADFAGNVEGGKTLPEAVAAYTVPKPDLLPISMDVRPSPPLLEGTIADLSVDVENEGNAEAGHFDILIFDDVNGSRLPDTGESIGSRSLASLAGHSQVNISVSWAASSPGIHSLCAYADPPPGIVGESNETNNVMCIEVLVQPGPVLRPDYVPISPLPISSIRAGMSSSVSFSIRVLNQGNGTATDNVTVAFHEQSSPPFSTFVLTPLAPAATSSRFTATWISPAVPGTYSVYVDVDHNGNVTEWDETNNIYTWMVDVVSGPVTSLVIGNPNYTSTVTYVKSSTPLDFSVLDQSGMGIRYTNYSIDSTAWNNYTATGSFFLAGEGEHTIDWFSEDFAGNVESFISIVSRVDDTPPATNMLMGDPKYLVGGNFVNSSTSLTLQATDGGATPVGLDRTEYRIDGGSWMTYSAPLFLTSEGAHAIDHRSYDLLMNTETIRSLQVTVDNTPPATSRSVGDPKHQAAQLFVKSTTAINLTSADGGVTPVGLAAVEYRVDGGIWGVYSSNITLTGSDGPHALYYMSRDLLGNEEAQKSLTLSLDNTPPATTINPDTGEFDITSVFTLTGVDSGSRVKVTRYRIDGGAWTDYSGGFTIPEGYHNVSYYSVDNLDNTEREKWLTVMVQAPPLPNTPPSVTLHTPAGGEEWLKDSLYAIDWTMHDDQDANSNLTVYVNCTTSGITSSIVAALRGGESFLWTLPDIKATDVVVNVTIVDSGGLKGWDQSGPFTIKAPPPPPSIATNYKPLVALIFAIILAVVGLWASKRRTWKDGMGVLKAFMIVSMPFVLVEAATGILSLSFEPLRIPPLNGWGTGVDCVIFAVGLLFLAARSVWKRETKAEKSRN